jgi:importin-9
MRVRTVFASSLAPSSPALFSAVWAELAALQTPYNNFFVEGETQGRLEDDDGLPYTLDFLVLEELDLLQACLKAAAVRKELEGQLKAASNVGDTWVIKFVEFAVAYAQIPTEEESLWTIDVGLYLSEETSVTTNYTPRTACAEFIVKLSEWLKSTIVEALLVYIQQLFHSTQSWKAKEASLFLLNQILSDFEASDIPLGPETANSFIEFLQHSIQHPDEFLRARGHIVAGIVVRTAGEPLAQVGQSFLDSTLSALNHDNSDIVKVACVRALQFYLETPSPIAGVESLQESIIQALTNFMNSQDLSIHTDSDDFMSNIAQTVQYAILLNEKVCLTGDGLAALFNIANFGAGLFMVATIVNETFENVVVQLSSLGAEVYGQLCSKVLPSLTGAFHISSLTDQNALTNLAADLLTILTKHGPSPLPAGLVGTIMPKMNQILLESSDEELLKSATCAVKNMLVHDPQQLFAWQDPTGKSGLEAILVIIDRLLGPTVDDNAAAEVGGLAAELVEKAGSERLGPYLPQLLRAVAVRLGTAEKAQFIQSLILVFARLSLVSVKEVVDFLGDVQMPTGENGLEVVLSKWLDNSVNFAGYDEIRQNVIALSKIYDLHDPRITQIQVKGDLIVPQGDGRIMTRSRAKARKLSLDCVFHS